MSVMKTIFTEGKEVCSRCHSHKQFCEGCKISVRWKNDRVVLAGKTMQIEEVEPDFFKGGK